MSGSTMAFKRPENMQDLFADDPFNLLSDVGEKKDKMSFSDKIMSEFEEVAAFINEHNRLPQSPSDDFDEEELALSYRNLIKIHPDGQEYCESLLPEELRSAKVDRIQRTTLTRDEIIKQQVEDMRSQLFESIDDLVNADPFGILSGDMPAGELLDTHEYWKDTEEFKAARREQAEPNAQARVCEDFEKFKPYFAEVNRLLNEGHIKSVKLEDIDKIEISPGQFYVIDGVLSLIVGASMDKSRTKASNKWRYRVRQVFDNGSEILPFNTSVKASFYKSKTPCVRFEAADEQGKELFTRLSTVLDQDYGPLLNEQMQKPKSQGFVYILSTLSQDPVIKRLLQSSHLIKIGYTDKTVEERIAGAEKSSTYLFAPVKVLYKIECFDFDAIKLEDALHTVFAAYRLNVTLTDSNGKHYQPEEWFKISAETATQVVEHIMNNDLHQYYIDPIQGKLKPRRKK